MTPTPQPSSRRPARWAQTLAVLALAGTLAFNAQAAPPERGGPERPMADGTRGQQRLLDTLQATPEQRLQIEAILSAARADLRAPQAAKQALRAEMAQRFAQPSVDANAVEELRQQLLALHDQTGRRWMQALLDISGVLTPEQRQLAAGRLLRHPAMLQRHRAERGAPEAAPR
jgi:protein CpxP